MRLLYRELRGSLIARDIDHKAYAEYLGRSHGYISARFNDKAAWSMDDVYATLELLQRSPEDIPVLFPAHGVKYDGIKNTSLRIAK